MSSVIQNLPKKNAVNLVSCSLGTKADMKVFVQGRFTSDTIRELSKCKLDLVGVQEVRWEGGGTEPAGEYTLLYGKGNENHELGTGFCV
jgi:hypothetical protein